MVLNLALLTATLAVWWSAPAGSDERPLVFVLAGQSNMAGRGQPIPDQSPSDQILEYMPGQYLRPAKEPLAGEQGIGPGMAFARAVRERHPDRTVILLPCAKGASWMKHWQPGGWLYRRCVDRARHAQRRGEIAGVLFWQGESDAQNAAVTRKWEGRFLRFTRRFRQDIREPDVPLVFAVLGETTQPRRFHEWRELKHRQRTLRLPDRVDRVESDDQELQDNVHYTPESYQAIGRRFAAAWAKVRCTSPTSGLDP